MSAVITLAWWVFIAALVLAAIVGGVGAVVAIAVVADMEDAPADPDDLTEY